MKRIAIGLAAAVLTFSLSACGAPTGTAPTTDNVGESSPQDGGGIGMTYNGKQGIDLGGGLVMPFDGSGVQPGFGF